MNSSPRSERIPIGFLVISVCAERLQGGGPYLYFELKNNLV